MLHLILGQSGTGKTEEIIKQVTQTVKSGREALLLVPEHVSFEMERRLYGALLPEEAMRLRLLSFPRLSENIFRECGGLTHRALDDMSRIVIMRTAVSEVRDSLKVYKRQASHESFLSEMLDTIGEWKRAGMTPDSMQELAARRPDDALNRKIEDIALIFGTYQTILERSFHDPLDDLTRAAEMAERVRWFEGREIWLDGFDYFSIAEREMINVMLGQSTRMTVAMTADGLSGESDLFVFQKKYLRRLILLARERDIKVETPLLLTEKCRFKSPELGLLQDAFLGEETGPLPKTGNIRLFRAGNAYEEMHAAAALIMKLVREEGYRFSDIAVLCRDLDRYRSAYHVLDQYGVAYYLSEKDRLIFHALPSFLIGALEAVSQDLPSELLLKLARSPASGLSEQEAGELENYCYIWSIQGRDWLSPFTNNPEGMSDLPEESYRAAAMAVDASRKKIVEPLLSLRRAAGRCTGAEFAKLLYRYLTETDALQNLSEGLDEAGRERLDREWNCIVDVLDLLTDFFGNPQQDGKELAGVFRLALSQIDLGDVPNTIDHVTFAEADRVRLSSPRAVFVLGVNEGLFPAPGTVTGLFTGRERETLNEAGVELPMAGTDNALREQFILYSALSAPAERLFISYTTGTLKGEGNMELSVLVSELAGRLNLEAEGVETLSPTDFVVNLETAKLETAARWGKNDAVSASLQSLLWEAGEGDYLAALDAISKDLPAGSITPRHAKALLGDEIRLSPTSIERFYQCPYFYLCDHLLRLRPRQRVELSPFESGSAIHYVLEQMLNHHRSDELAAMTPAEQGEEIEQYLKEYISRMVPDEDAVSARFHYQFARLRLMLGIILRHLSEELAQSEFITAATEVSVGEGKTVLPPLLETENETPIRLVGSIDRVDLFKTGEENYIRVVDYKSGEKNFKLEEVFDGINMQMLIYLYAVCDDRSRHFGTVLPAGILYAPTKLQAVDAAPDADEETIRNEVNSALKRKGLLLDDPTVLRAMERDLAGVYIPAEMGKKEELSKRSQVYTREQFAELKKLVYQNITEMGEMLERGEVSPMPAESGGKRPCAYCEFASLCNHRGENGAVRIVGQKEKGGDEE